MEVQLARSGRRAAPPVAASTIAPPSASVAEGPAPAAPRKGASGVPLERDWLSRSMLAIGAVFGRYHHHQVVHLERLGRSLAGARPTIIVANHVIDVIDPLLFVKTVYERYGVVPRVIGHRAWFRTPGLREIVARYRVIPARDPAATSQALRDDGLLMLFPGGAREAAVRDYEREPYRLKWEGRMGFLRLALENDADILFVAALGTEAMYYQSRVTVPEAVARHFGDGDPDRYRDVRIPFGPFGPHLLPGVFPFPAPITHVVSQPIDLGDRVLALRDGAAFAALHQRVWRACQTLLDDAVSEHESARELSPTVADYGVRAGHALLRRIGL